MRAPHLNKEWKGQYYPFSNTLPTDLLALWHPFQERTKKSLPEPINIFLMGAGEARSLLQTIWLQSKTLDGFSTLPPIHAVLNDNSPAIAARATLLAAFAKKLHAATTADDKCKILATTWEVWFNIDLAPSSAKELSEVLTELLTESEDKPWPVQASSPEEKAIVRDQLLTWSKTICDPPFDGDAALAARTKSGANWGMKGPGSYPLPRTAFQVDDKAWRLFCDTGRLNPWSMLPVRTAKGARVLNPTMWPRNSIPNKATPWEVHMSCHPMETFPKGLCTAIAAGVVPLQFVSDKLVGRSPGPQLEAFGQMLDVYGSTLSSGSVAVTLSVEDALTAALHPRTPQYSWDVVHTTNLMDHIPLLPLLIASARLLRPAQGPRPASVMFCSSLRNDPMNQGPGNIIWSNLRMSPMTLALTLNLRMLGGGSWSPDVANTQEQTAGATGFVPSLGDLCSVLGMPMKLNCSYTWAFVPIDHTGNSALSLPLLISQNPSIKKTFQALLQATFNSGPMGGGELGFDTPMSPKGPVATILSSVWAIPDVLTWFLDLFDDYQSPYWNAHILSGNYCQSIVACISQEVGGPRGLSFLKPAGPVSAELHADANYNHKIPIDASALKGAQSYYITVDLHTTDGGHSMWKDLTLDPSHEFITLPIPAAVLQLHDGDITVKATQQIAHVMEKGKKLSEVTGTVIGRSTLKDALTKGNPESIRPTNLSRALRTAHGLLADTPNKLPSTWQEAGGTFMTISSVLLVDDKTLKVNGQIKPAALERLAKDKMTKLRIDKIPGDYPGLCMGLRVVVLAPGGSKVLFQTGRLTPPVPVIRSQCKMQFSRENGVVALTMGLQPAPGLGNLTTDCVLLDPLPRLCSPKLWASAKALKGGDPGIKQIMDAMFLGAEIAAKRAAGRGSGSLSPVAQVRDTILSLMGSADSSGSWEPRAVGMVSPTNERRMVFYASGIWMDPTTNTPFILAWHPNGVIRAMPHGIMQQMRISDAEWELWEKAIFPAARAVDPSGWPCKPPLKGWDVPMIIRPLFAPRTFLTSSHSPFKNAPTDVESVMRMLEASGHKLPAGYNPKRGPQNWPESW